MKLNVAVTDGETTCSGPTVEAVVGMDLPSDTWRLLLDEALNASGGHHCNANYSCHSRPNATCHTLYVTRVSIA